MIADMLYKLGLLTDRHTEQFWLEKVHEFEGTLDIIRLWGEIPTSHRKKWNEFQGKYLLLLSSLSSALSASASSSSPSSSSEIVVVVIPVVLVVDVIVVVVILVV